MFFTLCLVNPISYSFSCYLLPQFATSFTNLLHLVRDLFPLLSPLFLKKSRLWLICPLPNNNRKWISNINGRRSRATSRLHPYYMSSSWSLKFHRHLSLTANRILLLHHNQHVFLCFRHPTLTEWTMPLSILISSLPCLVDPTYSDIDLSTARIAILLILSLVLSHWTYTPSTSSTYMLNLKPLD